MESKKMKYNISWTAGSPEGHSNTSYIGRGTAMRMSGDHLKASWAQGDLCQQSFYCTMICLGLRYVWFWTLASAHALHLPIIEVWVFCADWGLKSKVQQITWYIRVQYLELSLRFEGWWGVSVELSTKLEVLCLAWGSWIRVSEVMKKARAKSRK